MQHPSPRAKKPSSVMNADCGTTGPATPGLTVPLTAPLLAVSKNWSGAAALVGYMFSDQTLKLAVSNNHLVITWRQSPWIHRHIIAISFSRSNTVILKFISDLPQVADPGPRLHVVHRRHLQARQAPLQAVADHERLHTPG